MSDISDIGDEYIKTARELAVSSIKYLIGFMLVIIACWLFVEEVFYKTKYQDILLNQVSEKIGAYHASGKRGREKQVLIDNLNRQKKEGKAEYSELYQSVEENVPNLFKIVLRQATNKPFGVLVLSATVLALLIYANDIRMRYLKQIVIALRIIKEGGGYNAIKDYNFNLPIWVLPLTGNSVNGVLRSDIVHIGGYKHIYWYSSLLVLLLLAATLLLQCRLFYISLVTNYYLLGRGLIVQGVLVAASFVVVLLWLLPKPLNDYYKSEQPRARFHRRNFIVFSSILAGGLILGFNSKAMGRKMATKMLRPRYVRHKRVHQNTKAFLMEQEAVQAIEAGQSARAATFLFNGLSSVKPSTYTSHLRNFDLFILLCRKDPTIKGKYLDRLITLVKRSGQQDMISKSISWQDASPGKIQKQRAKQYWNKTKLW